MLTESWNVQGWRGPLEVISSNALLKQSHQELSAQDYIQIVFQYLQEGRLHNVFGQPRPVLCHCHSKRVFRHSLLYFSLSPLPLILSLGTTDLVLG